MKVKVAGVEYDASNFNGLYTGNDVLAFLHHNNIVPKSIDDILACDSGMNIAVYLGATDDLLCDINVLVED